MKLSIKKHLAKVWNSKFQ